MTDEMEPTAKVLFRVQKDDGSFQNETLWAYDAGADEYILDNSPFLAYGVSWEDRVLAPYRETEGFPTFSRVVSKSGNRTVRIICDPPIEPGNESDSMMHELQALGCSIEGASPSYLAVNIPESVELGEVTNFLIGQEAQWEYADPTFDEIHSRPT